MFRHTRSRLTVVSLLLASVLAILPKLVGVAQEQLQLGNMTYSRAEAPALRMPVTQSIRFFRGVGGVAFSAVAQGDGGLVVAGLRYDASAHDGQRLAITLRSRSGSLVTVRGDIHDWQLVPTARYARDENGSAVTLFGRLRDANATARLVRAGHRVINYHSALDNTLLGLRLFQADILIIRPEAADLFRQNGRPILGAGESGHDRARNLSRYQQLALWQDQQAEQGNQYQSYVVGDLGQRVAFGLREGSIVFSGEPFWHAWRAKHRTAADDAKRDALIDRYERIRLSYNALVDTAENGPAGEPARTRLTAMRSELELLDSQLTELEAIEDMPEYSRALTGQIRRLDGVNPIVYRTLTTVMHYRALFKHFQQRNAVGFSAFVDSLKRVPVDPAVTTPTIQREAAPQP